MLKGYEDFRTAVEIKARMKELGHDLEGRRFTKT
jgi:hypothetical protein